MRAVVFFMFFTLDLLPSVRGDEQQIELDDDLETTTPPGIDHHQQPDIQATIPKVDESSLADGLGAIEGTGERAVELAGEMGQQNDSSIVSGSNGPGVRIWGSGGTGRPATTSEDTPDSITDSESAGLDILDEVHEENEQLQNVANLTFQSRISGAQYPPPEGFAVKVRVYLDPADKLAHLDQEPIVLPYWDCGATGSTTSPLFVRNAVFRHSLSTTSSWVSAGKHPVLAVALTSLEIETSSGDSTIVQAGEAFLLEDQIKPGHRISPVLPQQEVQILFLTLPQKHYETGKEKVSLYASKTGGALHPCPLPESKKQASQSQIQVDMKKVQRWALAMVGLSVSSLVVDFLGKTAPLWLAVGVGGSCVVAAGTIATVVLGDAALTRWAIWREQLRLSKTATTKPDSSDQSDHFAADGELDWQDSPSQKSEK